MSGRITHELIRKKGEHHDGALADMEELSLHQLNLVKIETLHRTCHRLRILYLQNNLISKLENLRRMKDLQYLNLALNNIKRIENLQSCEKLQKLDFTVNFIPVENLKRSIENLKANTMLVELYMTGNPCCEFEGYRSFVIYTLPQLQKLDGQDISKTEKIVAKQEYDGIYERLSAETAKIRRENGIPEEEEWVDEESDSDDEDRPQIGAGDPNAACEWTPRMRREMAREEEEKERKKKEVDPASASQFGKKEDLFKQSQDRMNAKVEWLEGDDIPRQRNVGRYDFTLNEDNKGNHVAEISVPRFLDTSLIDVDVHPSWFQCIVKGKNILMHLDPPCNPDKTRVQRNMSNGKLILTMPIQDWTPTSTQLARIKQIDEEQQMKERDEQLRRETYKKITQTRSKKEERLIREVSAKRNKDLQDKLDKRLREEEELKQEKHRLKKELIAAEMKAAGIEDDDDCPPLF